MWILSLDNGPYDRSSSKNKLKCTMSYFLKSDACVALTLEGFTTNDVLN